MASPPSIGPSRIPTPALPGPKSSAGGPKAAKGQATVAGERQHAREVPVPKQQRQFVDVEGRTLDLSAPRGTYLNILV